MYEKYVISDHKNQKLIEPESLFGGNLIDYPGEVIIPTSDLTTTKLHVNSVICGFKYQYMCMDIKDFYLNISMDREEYTMIHIYMIPSEFMIAYNIKDKVHNGYIFSWVTKGMYRIP